MSSTPRHSFIEKEDYLTALSWCNAALAVKEQPEYLYSAGYCLYGLSAFDRAKVPLEKCLAIDPDNIRVPRNPRVLFRHDRRLREKTRFYLRK
jgi:tetratricopeptide (TPR) repeat protein